MTKHRETLNDRYLDSQMDELAHMIGFLACYTIDNDDIEHVKKYIADRIDRYDYKGTAPLGLPEEERVDANSRCRLLRIIQNEIT